MGYRNQHGLVGQYKGSQVYCVTREEYDPNSTDIQIITDEDLIMVQYRQVIGTIDDNGRVTNCRPYDYNYKRKNKQQKKKVVEEKPREPMVVDDVLLDITIPEGYFSQFTQVVDGFFLALEKEGG